MPRIGGEPRGDGVQAVALALQILETMAARGGGGLGVTELSVALGTSKSRVYRHLRTLVEHEYLVQEPASEKYRIGRRLATLGRAVGHALDIVGVAREPMRDLRDALGHSVAVAQIESSGVSVLETMSGNATIAIGVKRGSILGFHCSAQGKVALAFADPALRTRVCAAPLEALTPSTIVDSAALSVAIDAIAAQGWGVSPNETVIGTNALAVPIFGAGGLLAGTLAIIDSVQFIEPVPSAEQIRLVSAAAERVSVALGAPARRGGGQRGGVARRTAPAPDLDLV